METEKSKTKQIQEKKDIFKNTDWHKNSPALNHRLCTITHHGQIQILKVLSINISKKI